MVLDFVIDQQALSKLCQKGRPGFPRLGFPGVRQSFGKSQNGSNLTKDSRHWSLSHSVKDPSLTEYSVLQTDYRITA